ncbi:MAG TPA: hypothetical protein PKA63_07995 [Oligoflexia bacterium]|nr:hypothetical protein [Oligoflexia bacterium]HMP48591.1 hypothetical protein [Oligoflexia bacterium]
MIPNKPNQVNSISDALSEAKRIVEGAEIRAREILEEANASVEKIKNDAYQDGHREGHKFAITNAVRLIQDHAKLKRKIADEAAKLSYLILEKVLKLETPEIIDPLSHLARSLFSSITIGKKIDLLINPASRNSLVTLEREISDLARNTDLYVVETKDIPQDTILVRTDFGEIQVSLGDLLSEIKSQTRIHDFETHESSSTTDSKVERSE